MTHHCSCTGLQESLLVTGYELESKSYTYMHKSFTKPIESPQCKLIRWELTIPGAETIDLRKIRVYLYFMPNQKKSE